MPADYGQAYFFYIDILLVIIDKRFIRQYRYIWYNELVSRDLHYVI